jgi:HAD superfamily hydrolase (TIGR01509 family)
MAGSDAASRGACGARPGARALPEHVRALIYDFDDTIVGSERINTELFSRLMRETYGIDLTPEEQVILYGFAWTDVFTWLRVNRGFTVGRAAVWDRFLDIKREYFATRKLRAATGLDLILSLPVPRAIVSGSTRPEVLMMLENIGLPVGGFAFILCDEDYARGKPDPDPFLLALERLGIAAGDAVVFEDSEAGLVAARAAGVTAAFVAELAASDRSASADLCFADFREAWAALKDRM